MMNTRIYRYIAIGITALVLGWLIYTFRVIVSYILIAWVLSLIGQPVMRFFERNIRIGKWKPGRGLTAGLTLVCFFLVLGLLVLAFVPVLIKQAGNLANVDYQSIATALEDPINRVNIRLKDYGLGFEEKSPEQWVKDISAGIIKPDFIKTFVNSFFTTITGFFVGLFTVVFIAFFFLKEHSMFDNVLVGLFPERYEKRIRDSINDIVILLRRYFNGIALQMTVVTAFVSIFLRILGVPNALLIGFFAAILNLIPYLGPILGGAFGILLTISSNLDLEFYTQMMPLLVKVLIVFSATQMLDNYLLQPTIFSRSVLAHPLEIFIVVLMGAQINGVSGMILAIPIYTILRVIARTFLKHIPAVDKLTDSMKDAIDEPGATPRLETE